MARASSDELKQCMSGFQFDSFVVVGIAMGGTILCIFGNSRPGQYRAV